MRGQLTTQTDGERGITEAKDKQRCEMAARLCTASLRDEGGKSMTEERLERKKNCMLAWLCVFLFGLFGGLLLIKLLLHDAPS